MGLYPEAPSCSVVGFVETLQAVAPWAPPLHHLLAVEVARRRNDNEARYIGADELV